MSFFKNYIYIIIVIIILVLVFGKYLGILRKNNKKVFKGSNFSLIITWLMANIILYILLKLFTGIILTFLTGAYNSIIWGLIFIIITICSDMCFVSIVDDELVGLLYKEKLSDIKSVELEDWGIKVKFIFKLKNGRTRTFKTRYNEELIEIFKNKNIEIKINLSPDNYK